MTTELIDRKIRVAIYTGGGGTTEELNRYMPANYGVAELGTGHQIIVGYDHAGWTMDGYVLPRLASGLHFATEVT